METGCLPLGNWMSNKLWHALSLPVFPVSAPCGSKDSMIDSTNQSESDTEWSLMHALFSVD